MQIQRESLQKEKQQLTEKPFSRLSNWPVQIKLAPIQAPYFEGAKLLIAADCTAYAYASMHEDFMKGKVTLIGCSIKALFESMYKLYAENADLTSILLGENGDIKFFHTLQNLLKERCLQDWGEIIRMRHIENFEAYFNFLVGGCISLLQHWFASGMKETPAELAEITVRFLGFDI